MDFIKAKRFNSLSPKDKQVLENFLGHTMFDEIRDEVSVFQDFESFEWIKEGYSLLSSKLKFFLLGYYFATKPVAVMKGLIALTKEEA